jgi:hypothetical protein
METALSIYECQDIIEQIESLAEQNGGEITDQQLDLLVQAQTQSLDKLGRLCGFMRFLAGGIDLCKQEEQRITAMRERAENKLESVKRFLIPFVSQYKADKGHPLTVGTFTLSTRKSTSVEIDELRFIGEENRKNWCVEKVTYTPDKAKIKVAIQAGERIDGATIVVRESLQLK